MAVTFDTTTYPLETSTKFKYDLGTLLDRMSDGSVRSRTITNIKPVEINCAFAPQSEAESLSFIEYLHTVAGVELDIPHNTRTYRGFIDGRSLDKRVADGILHAWTFNFAGRVV